MSRAKGAILINAGGRGDSTGPGRLLVRAARCFARRGYLVCRFDTLTHTSKTEDRNMPRSLVDLEFSLRALHALSKASGTNRFSLVSLCRGLESVFLLVELSTRSLIPFQFPSIVLWSPQPMIWDIRLIQRIKMFNERLKQYLRKMAYAETWKKVLRGELHMQGIVSALRGPRLGDASPDYSLSDQLLGGIDRAELQEVIADVTASPPRLFTRYRGNILMVAPEFDSLGVEGIEYYRALLSGKSIDIQTRVMRGAGHNFSSSTCSEELFRITGEWLDSVTRNDDMSLFGGIGSL